MKFAQINYLNDVIMPTLKDPAAFTVVSLIARNTWGRSGTEWVELSFGDIKEATGISSPNTIKRAIVKADLFIEQRPKDNQGYEYRMKTISDFDISNIDTPSNNDTELYQNLTPSISKFDTATPDTSYKEKEEEKNNPPNPPGVEIELEMPEPYKPKYLRWLPVPLQCDRGMDTWAIWEEYRSSLGIFSEQSAKAQLKELGQWGIDRAEAAVKHSIKQGYKGIYEPKKPAVNGHHKPPAPSQGLKEIEPGVY